jgi:hypothetical protein
LRVLHEGFGNPKYAPCPLLVQMVTAGKLGVKSGEGFYQYTAGSKELVVAPPGAVDSMWLKVNVLGDLVNGTYRWQPQEKDAKMGSFTGTLENGTITALLSYEAEGRPGQEEMVMKVDSGGLRIGSGERVEEQGIWLFKDKGALAFGPLVPETTCP